MKNKLLDRFKIVGLFLLFSIIFSSFCCIQGNKNELNSLAVQQESLNTQTYMGEDGEHTIYWAKGVEAPIFDPKFSNDPNLEEGTGYFKRYVEESSTPQGIKRYEKYKYPMEIDKGYFDVNKNLSRGDDYPQQVSHHCYLASSINLIHWWLEQNSKYIDDYLSRYALDSSFYEQLVGLKDINDSVFWEQIRQPAFLSEITLSTTTALSQELSDDPIYKYLYPAYANLGHGYACDMPWDCFFNGYLPVSPNEEDNGAPFENTMETFLPSSMGGLFYPVFYKQKISERFVNEMNHITKYNEYKEMFKSAFSTGKGVTLAHKAMGTASHAITAWGAEYDSQGELVRIFVSDSDDFNVTDKSQKGSLYGLFSYDIFVDNKGRACLTNMIGDNIESNAWLLGYYLLDLKTQLWEDRLNDKTKYPVTPSLEPLEDKGYSSSNTDIKNIEAKVKREDSGIYFYQWYKSTTREGTGEIINGATSNSYKPPKPTEQPLYYYYEVKNYKNGRFSEVGRSSSAKIYIDNNVVDSLKPTVSLLSSKSVDYTQYEQPKPIKISAYSNDGGELSYQWYYKINSVDLTPSGGTLLEGETYPVLYPDITTFVDNDFSEGVSSHSYYCIVTNTKSGISGNPVATQASPFVKIYIIKKADFNNALKPEIREISQSKDYKMGDIISPLFVNAKTMDKGVLSYEWYENGNRILDSNSPSFMPQITKPGTYIYKCKVINTNINATTSKTAEKMSSDITINVAQQDTPVVSEDNKLLSLSVENYDISPNFDKDIFNYSLTVENSVEEINIVAQPILSEAIILGAGNKTLQVGKNEFTISVQGKVNEGIKLYKIVVNRKERTPSSNAFLKTLSIENFQLTPTFNKNNFSYSLSVANEVERIKIIALSEDSNATVSGLGSKNLIVGDNSFEIKVTSEDGLYTKTYNIKVTRLAKKLSSDNFLISLGVKDYVISPEFIKTTLEYNLQIPYSVEQLVINYEKSSNKSRVEISGNENLMVGDNIIEIKVIAEDNSIRIYKLNVVKEDRVIVNDDNQQTNSKTLVYVLIGVVSIVIVFSVTAIILHKKRKQ